MSHRQFSSAPHTRRGRPALVGEVVEVHIHLRLRRGDDDDLITFFERAGARRRVLSLKQALRTGNLNLHTLDNSNDEDELADALAGFVQ